MHDNDDGHFMAINNTDASGLAHVIGFTAETITGQQWFDMVDVLTGFDEEPFGFRAEVGRARRVLDPVEALNLIDRDCFDLASRNFGDPEIEPIRPAPVAYTDGKPDVDVLVTLPDYSCSLEVHTETIRQLLSLGGTAAFSWTARRAAELSPLPGDCVHLRVTRLGQPTPRTYTVSIGNPNDPESLHQAASFAFTSGCEQLVFLPAGGTSLYELIAS